MATPAPSPKTDAVLRVLELWNGPKKADDNGVTGQLLAIGYKVEILHAMEKHALAQTKPALAWVNVRRSPVNKRYWIVADVGPCEWQHGGPRGEAALDNLDPIRKLLEVTRNELTEGYVATVLATGKQLAAMKAGARRWGKRELEQKLARMAPKSPAKKKPTKPAAKKRIGKKR